MVKKTVLVIDDDKGFLASLSAWLRGGQFTVVEQSDFDKALATAVAVHPDAIILDLWEDSTDEVKGIAVAQQIRDMRELDGIPIIYYTASDRKGKGTGPIGTRDDLRRPMYEIGKEANASRREYFLTKGEVPPTSLRAKLLEILG